MQGNKDSTAIKTLLKQARKLIDSSEYEEAKRELDKCLLLSPDMYQALVLKGFACNALNERSTAAECFERATRIEPNNTLAWRGILETLRSTQEPKELEKLIQALDMLIVNQQDPNKKYVWMCEKADCLFKLAVGCRQLEKAYESGLLWKQLANTSSAEQDKGENWLHSFRSFCLVEEIACEGTTESPIEFSHCPWYSLLSVANQIAVYRCYRGFCDELNQLLITLYEHFSSIPWTEEDLQKFIWRQKLQLMVQSMKTRQENGGDKETIAMNITTTLQQWEFIYRVYYSSRDASSLFFHVALECYFDDFMCRPNKSIIQLLLRNCQKAIREHPLHYTIAYAYLVVIYWIQQHCRIQFSNIPRSSDKKNSGAYIIYYLVELMQTLLRHSDNIFSSDCTSILSYCSEAIAFIQEIREYGLYSFGQMEYIFRFIRCYYKVVGEQNVQQKDEDWQWLQKHRFVCFEQDWQRLEWIIQHSNGEMEKDRKQPRDDYCNKNISRFIWNEIGKQRWIQDKNTLQDCWNIALSSPVDYSEDILMSCFQFIRRALHIDDIREKSRTCCLLAVYYLYSGKELEKAEKWLIQATQNDASYELPFALLGFLFEYLSLNLSHQNLYQKRAIKCYQRCLLLSPQHEFANWRLYRLYSKTQQLEMAQQLLQQLTTTSSSTMSWPYILLGSLQLALGKKDSVASNMKSASFYFQTGLRLARKNSYERILGDEDLFIYLEPLLQDSMSHLQMQCMSSTAWFGLCDAYAADGRLSAALASCLRGLTSLEKTCKEEEWTKQQLEMIHRRQLIYRVKKGHLLASLNRLDEAVEELESVVEDQKDDYSLPCSSSMAFLSWTRGQVYYQQAVSQYWSNGLYGRALHTLEKAISCFHLQNNISTDLAMMDRLGIAICTMSYWRYILDHPITDNHFNPIQILRKMIHRYPHHPNNYAYWAFMSLFPHHSTNHHLLPSKLAVQLTHWSKQSMKPKHLLFASFAACLLLFFGHHSNDNLKDSLTSALSWLGQLPGNKRYSNLLVSLFFAALCLPLEENNSDDNSASTIAYAFIQDALRRDPCKDTAWLLLGLWREKRNWKDDENILSCYLEAIRLACNRLALLGATRVLRNRITRNASSEEQQLALCFAFAYRTQQQSTVQRELLPWFEKIIQQKEENNRQAITNNLTKWQIQRCIHQMPHLYQHWKLLFNTSS